MRSQEDKTHKEDKVIPETNIRYHRLIHYIAYQKPQPPDEEEEAVLIPHGHHH